jgi:CheY-like chemotaxis protein
MRSAGLADYCVKPARQSMLFDCLATAMATAPATPRRRRAGASASDGPQKKTRVLIAEDNIVNRKVALAQLKLLGYDADAVTDGLAALNVLENSHYDIVLMDCQMPEMDGYEATQRIRARGKEFPQPYIIAMTAHAMQGDRETCLAAGMNDYVSKPVLLETLAAALARGVPIAASATLPEDKSSDGTRPRELREK